MAFRSTVFLIWLVVILATTTLSAATWAIGTTVQLGAATAQLAAHRKELRRAVMRTRARARLRRFAVAVPVFGLGAVGYFERQDYREWLEENPGGSRGDYGCEVYEASAEVVEEFVEGLPQWLPVTETEVAGWLGECSEEEPEVAAE